MLFRMTAETARNMIAEAVLECHTIESLAQVVIAIDEQDHRDIIIKFLCETGAEKLKCALRVIRRTTQIRI